MSWASVSVILLKFYFKKNHTSSDLAWCTEMKHGNNAFKYIFFQFPSGFGVSSEQLSLILGIFILCACQTRPENSKTPKISCFKLPSPRLHDMKYLSDREHPWQEFRHCVLPSHGTVFPVAWICSITGFPRRRQQGYWLEEAATCGLWLRLICQG